MWRGLGPQVPTCSRKRPREEAAPASSSQDRPLRKVVADIFHSNKLSPKDIHAVCFSAAREGVAGVSDLARAGAQGTNANLARDLLRSLLGDVDMPEPFWHEIPLWDRHLQRQVPILFPFLLPHDMLDKAARDPAALNKLLINPDDFPEAAARHAALCNSLGLDCQRTVAIGMHGDGVPFTKHDSLEILSFNCLAQPSGNRVPFTGISKAFLCQCGCKGKCTWDALLAVFLWSMQSLCLWIFPLTGPSGELFPDGSTQNKHAGKPLQAHALLEQVRGDWSLRGLFAFPSWNSEHICWKCMANKSDRNYQDCSAAASWRSSRYKPGEFLRVLQNEGLSASPVISCPGFNLDMVVLDWLHIVDLGVAQDLLGCLFWEAIAGGLPGASKKDRLQCLWLKIQQFYSRVRPPSVLNNLTEEMIKRTGKAPKLRAKGGETRYLIPFGAELAQVAAPQSVHWQTVGHMFDLLAALMRLTSARPYKSRPAETACRQMCVLHSSVRQEALAKGELLMWQMKPKVHLLQELVEYQSHDFGSPQDV